MSRRDLLRPTAVAAVFLPLAFGLGACADDDGAAVRDCSSSSASGGGGSASGTGGGSGTADCADASAAEAACSAVGEGLEADATDTIDVVLDEYAFGLSADEVAAGTITFATTNAGEENHELAFLPGGGDVPFTEDGAPDEDALAEAGAFELEAYGPGQDCNATYELAAGEYTLFCLVEAADGEPHVSKGMVARFTVA